MESLTDAIGAKSGESGDVKTSKTPDRVTLGKAEGDRVDKLLAQINTSSKGFLALTKSDVVNFLIRYHNEEFHPKELLRIRADHYDPIRHITWIAPQIKAALANGDISRVAELQAELRGVELSVIRGATTGQSDVDTSKGAAPRAKRKTQRAASQSESESKSESKSNPMAEAESADVKITMHSRETLNATHGV